MSNKKIIITSVIFGISFTLARFLLTFIPYDYLPASGMYLLIDIFAIWGLIEKLGISTFFERNEYGLIAGYLVWGFPVIISSLTGFLFILVARVYPKIRNIKLFIFIIILMVGCILYYFLSFLALISGVVDFHM